jgi:hypothetical protein
MNGFYRICDTDVEEYGAGLISFALIENEHRIKQTAKGIRNLLYSQRNK